MVPLTSAPPLHLAIVLAKDSLGTFDAVPERIQREGNGLEVAIRKFRMAAHLWQAFTGEQMYRNRFGRRCFRFEEEWQEGTLSYRDRENGQMRNEAKIHIIRTDKTLHEMRGIGLAQPDDRAKQKDELFGIALHAVNQHFKPIPGQKQYVSVLLIDSHWDKQTETITGHAAFGGGTEDIQLAIFGSHALQSYPSCIEEVIPAFSDCTRTDTNHVANDCSGSGSSWEAAIMSIGAHLRETGHLFSYPNQVPGAILLDHVRLNRTFVCREPYSTRTKSPGLRLCLPKDECGWHRLACLRFRYHPCFRLPTDPPPNLDGSVQAWPIGNGSVMVTAPSGLAWIELHTDEKGCEAHIEYGNGQGQQRETLLMESDLRNRLPEDSRNKRLRLCIYSAGQGLRTIEDFSQFASKASVLKLANGQLAFRGSKLGLSELEGSEQQEVILESSLRQTKLLVQIKVYHSRALEGIEFIYEDFTSQLFGKRGIKADESEFNLGELRN
jgi:Putative peptidase family